MKIGNLIAGAVTETVKGVAGTAGSELKKAGKSMFGQVGGSSSASASQASAASDKTTPHYNYSPKGETKKFGLNILSQVAGTKLSYGEIEQMRQKDEEFSSVAHGQLRDKINAMYANHQQRRRQEAENRQHQEEQVKQEKKQHELELRKTSNEPWESPAIAKTRAEIKNYGAE